MQHCINQDETHGAPRQTEEDVNDHTQSDKRKTNIAK